jgi:hypothetical protein
MQYETQCVYAHIGSRITAPIPAVTRTNYRSKNRGWLTAQPVSRDVLTGYAERSGNT